MKKETLFNILSTRNYQVACQEHGVKTELNVYIINLKQLLSDDGTELNFALQEQIDKILDLKIGESIYVFVNRDNKNLKGIILRTV